MSRRIATAVVDSPVGGLDAARRVSGPARRFCYSKPGQAGPTYVIVDIDAEGREEWAEQESGELAWYPFVPSTVERAMVRAALTADRSWREWEPLDSPDWGGR